MLQIINQNKKIIHLRSLEARWAILSDNWKIAPFCKLTQIFLPNKHKWTNHSKIALPKTQLVH